LVVGHSSEVDFAAVSIRLFSEKSTCDRLVMADLFGCSFGWWVVADLF
jgi:hypothetical protein